MARIPRPTAVSKGPCHNRWAMDYTKIITIDPDKRSGKPCIRGTRMTVTDVLEYLAGGMTLEELHELPKRASGFNLLELNPTGFGNLFGAGSDLSCDYSS